MEIEKLIKIKLEKIKPYIHRHGGDIDFIKFEDGCAFIKLSGSCDGCLLVDDTLEFGIEELLIDEIPGVTKVKLVS